jgi:hypothetical protein
MLEILLGVGKTPWEKQRAKPTRVKKKIKILIFFLSLD